MTTLDAVLRADLSDAVALHAFADRLEEAGVLWLPDDYHALADLVARDVQLGRLLMAVRSLGQLLEERRKHPWTVFHSPEEHYASCLLSMRADHKGRFTDGVVMLPMSRGTRAGVLRRKPLPNCGRTFDLDLEGMEPDARLRWAGVDASAPCGLVLATGAPIDCCQVGARYAGLLLRRHPLASWHIETGGKSVVLVENGVPVAVLATLDRS